MTKGERKSGSLEGKSAKLADLGGHVNNQSLPYIPRAKKIPVGDLFVLYVEHWLPDPEGWWSRLKDLAWSAEEVKMYGKALKLKRQTANYGDNYGYNPNAKPGLPWPDSGPVMDIKKMLEEVTGKAFTQCACNLYEDGKIVIGAHHDKRNPSLIASVSFGAERKMGFCEHSHNTIDKTLPLITLAPGSLVLFDSTFNSKYKHGIVEDKTISEPRISMTYRVFDAVPVRGGTMLDSYEHRQQLTISDALLDDWVERKKLSEEQCQRERQLRQEYRKRFGVVHGSAGVYDSIVVNSAQSSLNIVQTYSQNTAIGAKKLAAGLTFRSAARCVT